MSSKTCLLLRHFIILLKVCVLWCDVNFYIYVIFLKAMCYGILKYVIFLKTMCYDILKNKFYQNFGFGIHYH